MMTYEFIFWLILVSKTYMESNVYVLSNMLGISVILIA